MTAENAAQLFGKNGEPGGTRTRDHRIKSAMLYQLSYRPLLESGESSYCSASLNAEASFASPAISSK